MDDETARKYPEHAKLEQTAGKSQTCGEFLEWLLNESEYSLSARNQEGILVPTYVSIDTVLAKYFGIDQKRLNAEKDKMLGEVRVKNTLHDIEKI